MRQMIELEVPLQLQMLCELLETTVQEVMQVFIHDVSMEVNSSGSDEREQATGYFMRCGYGMHCYACEQVMEMFEDLNWLRFQRYEYRGEMYKALHKQFLQDWFKEWAAKKQSGE